MNEQNIEFQEYVPRGRIPKGVVDNVSSIYLPSRKQTLITVMKEDGKLLHRTGGNQRPKTFGVATERILPCQQEPGYNRDS